MSITIIVQQLADYAKDQHMPHTETDSDEIETEDGPARSRTPSGPRVEPDTATGRDDGR